MKSPVSGCILLVLASLLVGAASPDMREYRVDPQASAVSARVAFFALAHKTAHFPSMSGRVLIAPDALAEARVNVRIDARSILAPDKLTLRRLRGEKFFWVDRYPEIHFVGTGLSMQDGTKGTIEGKLYARGITRKETLAVHFDRPPLSAPPGQEIALEGTMTIDRYAYGMKAYRFVVGRKVTIRIRTRLIPS